MAVVARDNPNLALAECLAADGVGSMVYITGPAAGGQYKVASCDPSDFAKMPAIGMIIHKIDATSCVVQFRGTVSAVYAGLTPGETLFVDDTGLLSDEPPAPTVTKPFMFAQSIGIALSDDTVGLDPDTTMTRQRYP